MGDEREGLPRRFDRWMRLKAETRWGPLPSWRFTRWLERSRFVGAVYEAEYRVRNAWEVLRHG